MSKVFYNVEKYTNYYATRWANIQLGKGALKKVDQAQRKTREKEIEKGLNDIFKLFDAFPKSEDEREARIQKLKVEVEIQARKHLKINNPELENVMFEGIMDVTEKFIAQAKEFDPTIKPIDIMQAMRNVWIMNLIQIIAGRKVEYTPSIFAYSMLYPYTDNYLDDTEVSVLKKEEFNNHLTQRLKGEKKKPTSHQEEKVFSLVAMIESQYPRDEYEEVYDSVLCIQQGQIKSLKQQERMLEYQEDVLKISAEKGGTSVLTDAYLVCGKLNDALFDFAFGFGFLLQLIDDLQDIRCDIKNNHATMFSQDANSKKLDETASKLLAFAKSGIDYKKASSSPFIGDVKKLIVDNCILMIMEAISENKKYFTKKYFKFIKEHSELSFGFFIKANRKLKKKIKLLMDSGIL